MNMQVHDKHDLSLRLTPIQTHGQYKSASSPSFCHALFTFKSVYTNVILSDSFLVMFQQRDGFLCALDRTIEIPYFAN